MRPIHSGASQCQFPGIGTPQRLPSKGFIAGHKLAVLVRMPKISVINSGSPFAAGSRNRVEFLLLSHHIQEVCCEGYPRVKNGMRRRRIRCCFPTWAAMASRLKLKLLRRGFRLALDPHLKHFARLKPFPAQGDPQ